MRTEDFLRVLTDFVSRDCTSKEVNKTYDSRVFIKSGCAGHASGKTRKQQMLVVSGRACWRAKPGNGKRSVSGQVSSASLTFATEEEKGEFRDAHIPNVGEYDDARRLLALGKRDVLGIYVSGHPMARVRGFSGRKHDDGRNLQILSPDEDSGRAVVEGWTALCGHRRSDHVNVTAKTYKDITSIMAFVTLEDLVRHRGESSCSRRSIENVTVRHLTEEIRVFVRKAGPPSADDPVGKLICEEVYRSD